MYTNIWCDPLKQNTDHFVFRLGEKGTTRASPASMDTTPQHSELTLSLPQHTRSDAHIFTTVFQDESISDIGVQRLAKRHRGSS